MSEVHTRPERFVDLRIARRLRAIVLADPCAFCKHREMIDGIARCQKFGRTWWECKNGISEPTFDLDLQALEVVA